MTDEATPLSAALEAALIRELRGCYDWENHARFGEKLRRPVLVLSDTVRRLGHWDGRTRTLALARAFVLDRPWPEIIAVLQHEMAHQYVDEVLQVHAESAHGATFAEVCAQRGIDGRAAGEPIPATADVAGERVLDRIRKLLALAASANQNEAEVAMRRAHELMLRHNIDEAAARTDRAFAVRYLGDPSRRGTRVESAIIGMLTEFFFIEAIRIPVYLPRLGVRGHQYELTGTSPNLDMAVHVHEFLLATCERLWRANRHDARVKSGRDRLSYQMGVIAGFRAKLVLERSQLAGTGLVWTGDADLAAFYRRRNPRITTRRATTALDGAHRAGVEAGAKVVLHRPVESGPGRGKTRLLPGS
jgi:hypothetical protein